MNRRQRETEASALRDEEEVLKAVTAAFEKAKRDVNERIAKLDERTDLENLQSIVYQRKYQQAIKKQIEEATDFLVFMCDGTINDYLEGCYKHDYLATMYDLAGQGIPVIAPINQAQLVKAVQIDSKLSKKLYDALGENVEALRSSVAANVSRAIAQGKTWKDAAVWLAEGMNSPYERGIGYAMRIARTEGHRIQTAAALDGMHAAKERGAKIVKQWDATLDGRTRKDHRKLDGQIRELDEDFEVRGHKCRAPGHFGRPEEDINCRCKVRQRATWALDDEELERLKERAAFHGLDKTKDFEDFKAKYLEAVKAEPVPVPVKPKEFSFGDRVYGGTTFHDSFNQVWESEPKVALDAMYDKLRDAKVPEAAHVWGSVFSKVKIRTAEGIGKEGAWYDPGTGRITLDKNYRRLKGNDAHTSLQTMFHEVGHAVDDYLEGQKFDWRHSFSESGELGRIIKGNWDELVETRVMLKSSDIFDVDPDDVFGDGDAAWKEIKRLGLLEWEDTRHMSEAVDAVDAWIDGQDAATKSRLWGDGVGTKDWLLTASKADMKKAGLPKELVDEIAALKLPTRKKIETKLKNGWAVDDIIREMREYDLLTRNNISDWVECLTDRGYPLGFGHGTSYWKRKGGKDGRMIELSSEAFAELFDACFANHECWDMMEKYFPSATEWFRVKMKEVAEWIPVE